MLAEKLHFEPYELPASLTPLREAVRDFLAQELQSHSLVQRSNSWDAYDPKFSAKLGAKGWLGMTLPEQYGGHGRSAFERYVVTEECLAAGAPAGFHWVADRQSGPLIARYGSETQKAELIPKITAGEACFCLGMSEPNSGSDLASVKSRAKRVTDGWLVNGTKVWTTAAHQAHYMIGLFRTDNRSDSKHSGLSQFLIDMNKEGITPRPIKDLAGRRHFNEVSFENALLPLDSLIGEEGQGWKQVTEELAFERSGPDRYLSCFVLLTQLIDVVKDDLSSATMARIGSQIAWVATLRNMSISVASLLNEGQDPTLAAAIVKDLGCQFEQGLPSLAQELVQLRPTLEGHGIDYQQVLGNLVQLAPSFSLRGGTTEIMRGIIARGLEVR